MLLKKLALLSALIAGILISATLACPSVTIGDLTLSGRRVRPSTGPNTAAYLTITNSGNQSDKLIKVDCEHATTVELHNNVNDNGVMKMRPVEFIAIGKDPVFLQPGGLHIMLLGLKDSFQGKERVQLTFHFEKAGSSTMDFSVKAPEAPRDDSQEKIPEPAKAAAAA
jgi:copper(I)-binding protein